jgi:ABC-type glutathione transport system ATPase component
MLQIRDLTIRFLEGPPAVHEVSLSLDERDKMAIVGETGSGKSVLLLAMLRLLPRTARVSGKILYENADLLHCTEGEIIAIRGSKISYIPQGSAFKYPIAVKIGERSRSCSSTRRSLSIPG